MSAHAQTAERVDVQRRLWRMPTLQLYITLYLTLTTIIKFSDRVCLSMAFSAKLMRVADPVIADFSPGSVVNVYGLPPLTAGGFEGRGHGYNTIDAGPRQANSVDKIVKLSLMKMEFLSNSHIQQSYTIYRISASPTPSSYNVLMYRTVSNTDFPLILWREPTLTLKKITKGENFACDFQPHLTSPSVEPQVELAPDSPLMSSSAVIPVSTFSTLTSALTYICISLPLEINRALSVP
ncbi:hypothetical protein EDB19DRAFT_1828019 [Suillus lakei]|nr:hypothetical protein EDB19DRAFT_1828019 [Suillus lakei]